MDEQHVLAATRHVERNPVRARLVKRAAAWPWSSAAAHVSGKADGISETDWLLERIAGWVCSWEEHLRHPDAEDFGTMMQRYENTGRPLGDKAFVWKLESLLGRPPLPGQPGRPRKTGK